MENRRNTPLQPAGRGTRRLLCLWFSLAFLLAAIVAAPAQAAPETIAEFGQGAGEVENPSGAALHRASGDLYIADPGNFRIDKFDSAGDFLLAWGFGVADGVTEELQTCGPQATPPTTRCFEGLISSDGAGAIASTGVAVDQASGALYVVDNLYLRVSKFSPSGEFIFTVGRNVNETKVALGVAATQAEKNLCTAASGDTCGQGEVGTEPGEFDYSITAAAVDSTGVVWVGTTERLTSFDATGTPGAEILMPGAGSTQSLAIDSADNFYVISQFLPGVRKLEAGTGALLETLDAGGKPRTVTVDEDDNVYTGDCVTAELSCPATDPNPYRFKVYNPAGEQTGQFGAGEVIGAPGSGNQYGGNALAVDKDTGKLYAASGSTEPSESVVQAFPLPELGPLVERQGVDDVEPTTATLTARINPEGDETEYHFKYGTSDSYGESTPTQTLSAGYESEDVEAGIEGLIPDTIYHFRVVATNHCNDAVPAEVCRAEGPDQTFRTLPAVLIDPQWVTDVTAQTAVVHAEMDPLGVEAEAWLEYGTSDSYGTTVPLADLGDGFGPVGRQAFLSGLEPGTTYHFRFVGRDVRDGTTYTSHGPDQTFTTQFGGLGFALADGRVWEMVSPSDKHGAKLVGGGDIHIQASAAGNGIAYQTRVSTEEGPEGIRTPETSMNLAGRAADGSWASQDITPPNERATGIAVGNGFEYKLFNADLSQALLEPRSGTPLSPKASERTPYLRHNTTPHTYTPLVTGKEPFANVPPGIEFGGKGSVGPVAVAGASPDFQHVALKSDVPLVENPTPSGPTIYLWSGGQLEPVSVLPGEDDVLVSAQHVGSGRGSIRGAVSEDGSRVFWSRGGYGSTTALYVRDTEAGETGRLDVKQPSASGAGLARPVFQGASADGTVVFFADPRRLTEDAGSNGFNLYRCELPPGSIASGCATLTNVSAAAEAGESAEMLGIAAGMSEDGEMIYFVAAGVLDDTPNEAGESAVAGEPNLYLWQEGQGARFVATLAEEDKLSWGREFASSPLGFAITLSAAASPGGRYLAFMSQRNLTGYDNRNASSEEPAQEVFRYDALTDRLECVSCNPTGARPQGANSPGKHSLVDPPGLWQGLRAAAALPWPLSHGLAEKISLYRPRAVLDNGRVFFNAVDPLVSADSNGQWDVYQHEPMGVGDCIASSGGASVARLAGGCVSLISSGTAEEEAAFADASESGDDAFFWTRARLSVLDEDDETDLYDARVGGTAATLPPDTECLGEACQPAARVVNPPTPASAAFRGPGNVRPAARKKCPKGKRRVRRKGRVRCVAKKKQRSRRAAQRKASNQRRAGR